MLSACSGSNYGGAHAAFEKLTLSQATKRLWAAGSTETRISGVERQHSIAGSKAEANL
jgi:hypothetical protein